MLKEKKVKSVVNLKKLLQVYSLFWSLKTLATFANCTCKSFIKLTPVSYTFINFIREFIFIVFSIFLANNIWEKCISANIPLLYVFFGDLFLHL